MKRIITIVLSALLVVALATTAFAATAIEAPTVTVSATAKITVEPDIAYVSLGVRTENKSSKTAKQENTELMTKVLAALKKAGVDEKDIQTSNLSMYTNYSWDNNGNRKLTGYTVDNTVSVTVRDLDKVGDIVDAAMNAGANQFNNVSFGVEDEEDYYIQALTQATKKAKRRASAIAAASEMTLGKAVSISSDGANYNPYVYYAEDAVADEAVKVEGASIGSTINSGTVTVTATINATYGMK